MQIIDSERFTRAAAVCLEVSSSRRRQALPNSAHYVEETFVGTRLASGLLLKNKDNFVFPPYFVYAPPDFGQAPYPYRLPKAPYSDAPGWKCSVYYYWWLYLRRNDDYRLTCEQDGVGTCATLYRDFGDIYADDFQSWWQTHWDLFAERQVVTSGASGSAAFERSITVTIDLDAKRNRVLDELRNVLTAQQAELEQDRVTSDARYPVETNPVLSALHQHLHVWDMKRLNPWISDAVLADLADIRVNHVVNGVTAEQAEILGKDPVRIISCNRRT